MAVDRDSRLHPSVMRVGSPERVEDDTFFGVTARLVQKGNGVASSLPEDGEALGGECALLTQQPRLYVLQGGQARQVA